ncbi:MAG: glycosyltransferase [Nitrospirota bacterium]|nr:glycosyltransferase [Nitrospirota bacterium]
MWIVLPVHNRVAVTCRFADCLARQTFRDFTLLLVDDGCTDDTVAEVKKRVPNTVVIRGDGSLWWGGAMDMAYRHLKRHADDADLVLIVNDDVVVEDEYLEKADRVMRGVTNTLTISACYSQATGGLIDAGRHADWATFTFPLATESSRINCLSTRGLFLRVGDWKRIGGFHPFLLPHYGSDYEFTVRAGRRGLRLTCDRELRVFLDESTTGVRLVSTGLAAYLFDTFVSKRHVGNAFYKTSMILLMCDRRYMPRHLWRLWSQVARGLAVRMFSPRRDDSVTLADQRVDK